MPSYDYRCEVCKHEFSLFQSITADPSDTCPECGGKARRLIGAGAGIIFKGDGFYETDYKRKRRGSGAGTERKESESKDSGSESKESSSESKSSDSKGSGKSETKSSD